MLSIINLLFIINNRQIYGTIISEKTFLLSTYARFHQLIFRTRKKWRV